LDSVLTQPNTALAGRHVIEREIGHGGMAMVYLAAGLLISETLDQLDRYLGAVTR
jgi:hypothetical protein